MIKIDTARSAAEQVLNVMLAPDEIARDDIGTGVPIFRLHDEDGLAVVMNLRWKIPGRRLLSKPEDFLEDIRAVLEPISARITYGEVKTLRVRVEALEKQLREQTARDQATIADLKRYKDVYLLNKGATL